MGKATKGKKKKGGDSNDEIDVSNWEHKRTIGTQTDKRSSFDKLKEELQAQKITNSKLTDELERLGNENYDLRDEMKKVKETSECIADSAKEKIRDFRLKTKTAKDQSERVSQAVIDIHAEIKKFKEMMNIVNDFMNNKAIEVEKDIEAKKKTERVKEIKRRSFLTKCKEKLKKFKHPVAEEGDTQIKPLQTNRIAIMKQEKCFRDKLILARDTINNKNDNKLEKGSYVKELLDKLLMEYDEISINQRKDAEVLDTKEWENLKLRTELYHKDIKLNRSKQVKLNQEILQKHKLITQSRVNVM